MVLRKLLGSRRGMFFTTFVVVILTGLWVAGMLLRAWVLGPIDNPLLVILGQVGISQYFISGLIGGTYLGLSLLLMFDPMKRTQGVFLTLVWVGAVFVVPVMGGVLFPNETVTGIMGYILSPMAIAGAIIGLIFGLWAGGIRQVLKGDLDIDSFRLKRANVGIALITGMIILVGFVEAHVQLTYLFSLPRSDFTISQLFFAFGDTDIRINFGVPYFIFLFLDTIISLIFFTSVWQFVGYIDQKNISAVGPKRYGKTHFMIGLYDTVTQNDGTTDEAYPLTQKHTQLLNQGEWRPPTEGDPERLWFEYIHGIVHKKKRTVSMFDFPGEIFKYIKHGINAQSSSETQADIAADIRASADGAGQDSNTRSTGEEEDESSEEDDRAAEIAGNITSQLYDTNFINEIEDADTVLLLVDMLKFKNSINDNQQLADQFEEPSNTQSWSGINSGTSDEGYSWETGDSFDVTQSNGGVTQSGGEFKTQSKPWDSEDTTSKMEKEEGEDPADIPDIPTHEYKTLQSDLDANIAVVATKSHVYEPDVTYNLNENNYSRYQDFLKSKLNDHPIGQVIERSDLGLYPVFIRGDTDGPDTGHGQTMLSTFGFEELKEALEK